MYPLRSVFVLTGVPPTYDNERECSMNIILHHMGAFNLSLFLTLKCFVYLGLLRTGSSWNMMFLNSHLNSLECCDYLGGTNFFINRMTNNKGLFVRRCPLAEAEGVPRLLEPRPMMKPRGPSITWEQTDHASRWPITRAGILPPDI